MVEHAFGRDRKLRKTDEFSSVFRFKKVRRGEFIDAHHAYNALRIARLGLIVGKKNLPRAVDRNRAKRILRECFRLGGAGLSGIDLILRVKKAGTAAAYRAECEAHMQALAAWCAKNRPASTETEPT